MESKDDERLSARKDLLRQEPCSIFMTNRWTEETRIVSSQTTRNKKQVESLDELFNDGSLKGRERENPSEGYTHGSDGNCHQLLRLPSTHLTKEQATHQSIVCHPSPSLFEHRTALRCERCTSGSTSLRTTKASRVICQLARRVSWLRRFASTE